MKKHISFAFLLLVVVTFSACNSSQTPTPTPVDRSDSSEETPSPTPAADYIGLSVEDAEVRASANGELFRVVVEDGEPLPTTRDFQPGRINASVENGVVASYEVEGVEAAASPLSSDYIGLTTEAAETQAIANGVLFRVVSRDGEPLPATMDYRPGRINASVENDIVVSYEVEGEEVESSSSPAADYTGLTVEESETQAANSGDTFRVVFEDGEALPMTLDYRPGRINATVEDGVVISYEIEGEEVGSIPENQPEYTADSWKTMIPDTCISYFDGCNNCVQEDGAESAACTAMACEEYQEPKCLDADDSTQTNL